MTDRKYVLVTAAYNEERHIGMTIESVIHQTAPPERWVIVSDGSTDSTDAIVQGYLPGHAFMTFRRREKLPGRSYSSKAGALKEGLELLDGCDYSFYCTLDADVSFAPDYFENVLEKFDANEKLGIAGGVIIETIGDKPARIMMSPGNVPGAVQFFRRACFESTGGHLPSPVGGVDTLLEIKAKKNGWRVESFPELQVFHHRPMGTGSYPSILATRFKKGIFDYCFGKIFLFECMKCLRRIKEPPFFLSAAAQFAGYLQALFLRPAKVLSGEELEYVRKDQLQTIMDWLRAAKSGRLTRAQEPVRGKP